MVRGCLCRLTNQFTRRRRRSRGVKCRVAAALRRGTFATRRTVAFPEQRLCTRLTHRTIAPRRAFKVKPPQSQANCMRFKCILNTSPKTFSLTAKSHVERQHIAVPAHKTDALNSSVDLFNHAEVLGISGPRFELFRRLCYDPARLNRSGDPPRTSVKSNGDPSRLLLPHRQPSRNAPCLSMHPNVSIEPREKRRPLR